MAKRQKIVLNMQSVSDDEHQERLQELKKLFPEGYAIVKPVCERKQPRVESPRPEDFVRVLCTHLKIEVYRDKGTHPGTGLPRYEEDVVHVDLAVERPGKVEGPEPIEVRTDRIPGLRNLMDHWDVLEWFYYNSLNGHPQGFKMYRPSEREVELSQQMEKESRKSGAKAIDSAIKKSGGIPRLAAPKKPAPSKRALAPVTAGDDYESVIEGVAQEQTMADEYIEEAVEA